MAGIPVDGASKVSDTRRSVVARVGAVLTALMDSDSNGLTASYLAHRIDLPVPTVHRLLVEMSQTGLTLQSLDSKRWTLGPLALGLGNSASRQITLFDLVRPHLRQITEQTGETCVFALRDGLYATYADFIPGSQRLTLHERLGLRLPLTIGASRLVILANLPEVEREQAFLDLQVAGHVSDIDGLRRNCDEVRDRGYAFTDGALSPGASGVAVPLPLNTGPVVGSLMLAVPTVRCPEEAIPRFAAILAEHAAAIAPQHMPVPTRKTRVFVGK